MKNMKTMAAGIILLAALLVLGGCGKAETPQQKFQKEVSQQMSEIQKNVDKLKTTYKEKVAEMHKKFNAQVAAAQKKYNDAMADLNKKQAEAKKEMAALKTTTGAAWEKAKGKMEKTVEDLQKAYENLKSQVTGAAPSGATH